MSLEDMFNNIGVFFNKSSQLSSQRNFPEAIKSYKETIKQLHELEVLCQYSDNASSDLINSVNINLHNAYADIGGCYLDLTKPNFNEASRSYLNALVYGEEEATIGNLLYCMGQINAFMSATVRTFKTGELDNKFVTLHNQGYDLLKANSISGAANQLNLAIQINSKFAPTYHLLGLVFERMKKDNLAIQSWLKVLELDHKFNFEVRIKIRD